jgi:CDP-glucose 4,6-dehydratase
MVRVLVSGISGFCGGWLAKALLDKGYEIVGISRELSPDCSLCRLKLQDKVTLVRGDVLDRNLLKRVVAEYRPTYIVHLAAQAIVSTAKKIPAETFAVNVVGTANILEACIGMNFVQRILITSTDKVYGEGTGKIESDYLDADGIYENSKIAMERVAIGFKLTYNLPIIITRACNIYGAFDSNVRIVPNTIKDLKTDMLCPIIFKNDDTLRQYIYVEDVCSAYIHLMELSSSEFVPSSISYNVGTNNIIGQEEMVKTIIKVSGKKVLPKYIDKSLAYAEIQQQSLDWGRINGSGWQPKYSLVEGLRKTWELENDTK